MTAWGKAGLLALLAAAGFSLGWVAGLTEPPEFGPALTALLTLAAAAFGVTLAVKAAKRMGGASEADRLGAAGAVAAVLVGLALGFTAGTYVAHGGVARPSDFVTQTRGEVAFWADAMHHESDSAVATAFYALRQAGRITPGSAGSTINSKGTADTTGAAFAALVRQEIAFWAGVTGQQDSSRIARCLLALRVRGKLSIDTNGLRIDTTRATSRPLVCDSLAAPPQRTGGG